MPGPHDFAVRNNAVRLARLSRSLTSCLALRPHAHTTSSRPPHPAPRFVTIGRNAPLHRGGMRENVPVICPTGQAKYFSREGWTGFRGRRPSGKSLGGKDREVAAVQRFLFPPPRRSVAAQGRGGWREAPGG